jgi:membrane protease YdiL (CAAX protease family)
MRPLRALLIYIAVVFIGAALIAPWVHWLATHLFPSLAKEPFHRFVNRSLIFLALAGIWPLMRSLGTSSLRDIGLVKPSGQWQKLGAGFLLGFVSLAILAIAALMFHGRIVDQKLTLARAAGRLSNVGLTALVVAVLEEILFRGGIFGAARKVFHWRWALIFSSMIYAIVHFLDEAPLNGPVKWNSGFEVLPRMLAGFGDWQTVIPGFFNLTLAGMLLGLAYHRTGNLYFSIGLHAGWILWLQFYRTLTSPAHNANTWFWGSGKMIDGWIAVLVLSLAFVVLAKTQRPTKPNATL